jgi:hypothetical protein
VLIPKIFEEKLKKELLMSLLGVKLLNIPGTPHPQF